MIVTVTMNAAIDKTVELDSFEHGGLNRLKNIVLDAGGKGINVSKTIRELGGETVATGFVGGSSGETIKKVLKELGIQSDFVEVEGETRTNTKVVEPNGIVTELNEPGPVISEEKLEELMGKLIGYANENTLFILAGSIPAGVPKTIYKRIIEEVHNKGASVFSDADGQLFVNSLEAKPDIIKPNRAELEEFVKADHKLSEEELVEIGNKFIEQGIKTVAISMGSEGAMFITNDKKLKCPGLSVKAHSTVGAGDAMVAALSYGINQNLPFEECVKLGVAASAGAVTTIGTKPPKKDVVDELMKQVTMIELN